MRDLAKYRIVSRGSLVTIKSKLSLGEQINEREINVFERQLFRGCFRPRQEGKKIIIYTAPDVIELGAYLKNGCVLSDYCSDSRDDKKNRDEWVVSA